MIDPWFGFLNEQVAPAQVPQATLARACMRQRVLDRAASSFPFPLEVAFRGTVTDTTTLDGQDYLVVGPSGLSREALDVLGGVLVPTQAKLYPGAVLEVTCALADPDEHVAAQGFVALTAQVKPIVPLGP